MAVVPSLFQISQSTCIKQAAHITDVGDTPYHLIRPILKRLNAKQLAVLEENSPVVTPGSDEMWGILVEKDFPDRPSNVPKLRFSPAGSDTSMPRRALYKQYADERQQFLATSADRLRRMTEKLKKEKSKNSIIEVQGVLAEPTIRRRVSYSTNSRGFNSRIKQPNSILGKARRDVSNRSLMFGGAPRPHDPYRAFSSQNMGQIQPSPISVKSPPRVPRTAVNHMNMPPKHSSLRRDVLGPTSASSDSPFAASSAEKSSEKSPMPESRGDEASIPPESAVAPLPPRKRKPPPSIFLNSRKRPKIGMAKSPTKPRPKPAKDDKHGASEPPKSMKPIKAIRSSIFS